MPAPPASLRRFAHELWLPLRRRGHSGWRSVHLGALALALLTSPSTYRPPWRAALAQQVVRAAWPLLPWFALLSAIVGVVVIRIVLVSAQSYGLSQVALGMVVRVLVLELIPMSAALVVALRVSLPLAATLPGPGRLLPLPWLRAQFAPRVLAGIFSVWLLVTVSSLLLLLLTYLLAYGATPYALVRFTRLVGQVFDPVVTLVFILKTAALALAVAVLPLAGAALATPPAAADVSRRQEPGTARAAGAGGRAEGGEGCADRAGRAGRDGGALRMLALVLAIELLALAGNYLR